MKALIGRQRSTIALRVPAAPVNPRPNSKGSPGQPRRLHLWWICVRRGRLVWSWDTQLCARRNRDSDMDKLSLAKVGLFFFVKSREMLESDNR